MPLVQVPHERIAEMREKLHRHPAFTGQLDFAVGTSSKGDKVAWTATSRETGVPYNGKSFFIEGVLHHWSAISETGNMKHSKRYTKDELDTGIARFYTNAPADSKYAVHLRVDTTDPMAMQQVKALNQLYEDAQTYAAENPGIVKGSNPEFDKLAKSSDGDVSVV